MGDKNVNYSKKKRNNTPPPNDCTATHQVHIGGVEGSMWYATPFGLDVKIAIWQGGQVHGDKVVVLTNEELGKLAGNINYIACEIDKVCHDKDKEFRYNLSAGDPEEPTDRVVCLTADSRWPNTVNIREWYYCWKTKARHPSKRGAALFSDVWKNLVEKIGQVTELCDVPICKEDHQNVQSAEECSICNRYVDGDPEDEL